MTVRDHLADGLYVDAGAYADNLDWEWRQLRDQPNASRQRSTECNMVTGVKLL